MRRNIYYRRLNDSRITSFDMYENMALGVARNICNHSHFIASKDISNGIEIPLWKTHAPCDDPSNELPRFAPAILVDTSQTFLTEFVSKQCVMCRHLRFSDQLGDHSDGNSLTLI